MPKCELYARVSTKLCFFGWVGGGGGGGGIRTKKALHIEKSFMFSNGHSLFGGGGGG